MTQINPLAGSILQSTQVQRQAAVEKDRQVRRRQEAVKDAGTHGDEFDHQVESSEAINPIHDEHKRQSQQSKQGPHQNPDDADDDSADHLDLTA